MIPRSVPALVETAHHEAAHAVAHMAHGYGFDYVTIVKDDSLHSTATGMVVGVPPITYYHEIMIATFAGPLAEAYVNWSHDVGGSLTTALDDPDFAPYERRARTWNLAGDTLQLEGAISEYRKEEKDLTRDEAIKWVRAATANVLEKRWCDVTALAGGLLAAPNGRLTFEQCWEVLGV